MIGVKQCLEEDWFSNDVSLLAKSANEWRNELAHEKRSYEPESIVLAIKPLISKPINQKYFKACPLGSME